MEPELHDGSTVAEVMRQWPRTVGVFVDLRMVCPGCAMAPFETVAEAAAEYGLDARELVARLAAASEDRS